MKDVLILGTRGCAKEICFLLEENNKIEKEWNILGFVSEDIDNGLEYPILGNDEWLLSQNKEINVVCGVGDPKLKQKIIRKFLKKENICFPSIISKHALISDGNLIGKGTVICSGVTITTGVSIGEFVTINIGSTVCHESVIEDYTIIAPGVNISGNVKIGKCCDIGVGTKIIQNINIEDYSIIGAGSTIIRHVPSNVTVVGCPGRIIKNN